MNYEQDLKDYCKAMRNSDIEMCIAIEKKHYLFGYPPEFVTTVLSKCMNGMNIDNAVRECESA